jgi:hypothetical protein
MQLRVRTVRRVVTIRYVHKGRIDPFMAEEAPLPSAVALLFSVHCSGSIAVLCRARLNASVINLSSYNQDIRRMMETGFLIDYVEYSSTGDDTVSKQVH